MVTVTIHTDGSCLGNPGPGGWAAVLTCPKADGSIARREMSGGFARTTNNRMEILAVLEALGSSGYRSMTPKIYEESFQYRFLQNEENAKMLDLIHDSMTYDTGRIFSDDIAMFNLFRGAYQAETNWSSTLASKADVWQANIEKVNSILAPCRRS